MTIKGFQSFGFAIAIALTSPAAIGRTAVLEHQKPPTADEQSQSKADIALTQQIRRAVVKDKSLSVSAHNCKIITKKGLVTLRGEVSSEKEVTTIGTIAADIAGAGKVTNLLTAKVKKP
jgi:hyperosmotically inducible protein